MWQGTETNRLTTLEELNPASHPVSELGEADYLQFSPQGTASTLRDGK